ncbi:tRNA (adenine-N1)-methyltransferase [Marinithermus hydrothermalis]|uniref:tRNA (adenine(58)-N(1))-methyltransferase TrmI n=1 Tax=Marinithermus hydrothermalis (strain DSM 14884 / JCM 11576 / T1) TaxID=869210 RepID=F2NLH5_MARHT|nr:tRNA (adenine-N1)-methyltransferase [Marinithermus hydrothermalis]AEB12074.1 tRNA (adenine-N(1)-)-methyltransferase [Marinithermus hydrothermalis DSM 14884]
MRYGDLVLLRDTKGRKYLFRLVEGGVFSHHKGSVKHADILQARYGGCVYTNQEERLTVHKPTLEEYVLLMKRAATVTYPKDAAAMIMFLDLEPASRVLEAGSGSGGLTLFLARAVGPEGEVWSYEARGAFSKRARKNVEAWGVENVRFEVGDLAKAELPEAYFDGVALDLMEPWKVLDAVTPALKPDRALVAYLPNITQVVQLIQTIHEGGYPYLVERVIEVGHREWDVRPPVAHPKFQQVGHTAFLTVLRRLQG